MKNKNKIIEEWKEMRNAINYIIVNLEEDNIENKKTVFKKISFIEVKIGNLSDEIVEYFLIKS